MRTVEALGVPSVAPVGVAKSQVLVASAFKTFVMTTSTVFVARHGEVQPRRSAHRSPRLPATTLVERALQSVTAPVVLPVRCT